jgi:nitrogen regulatory protein P-II 1
MKIIKAILQPHIVSRVVHSLHELPNFPGFTLSEARGQGKGKGVGGAFKITEDNIDYHCKTILQIVCMDDAAALIANTIREAAHTGHKGDGIIIVSQLDQIIRIRTGEKQE